MATAQHAYRLLTAKLVALATGGAVVVDARAFRKLTVISGSGATVTVSRVDSATASAHTTGTENSFTVAATTRTVTDVDWPYFRISTASGAARIALI